MARDFSQAYDVSQEWQRVATAEQRARNVFLQAQERALHLLKFQERERANIEKSAAQAHADWIAARAALDAFVTDWRESMAGPDGGSPTS
jgi:hypothetical protein